MHSGGAINKIWSYRHLLALFEGDPLVTGKFPLQRPVTRSVDVFFNMRLNKRLNKQWSCRWFGTPWYPRDVFVMSIQHNKTHQSKMVCILYGIYCYIHAHIYIYIIIKDIVARTISEMHLPLMQWDLRNPSRLFHSLFDGFTVSLHSLNGRHLLVVRSVQADCQWHFKTVEIRCVLGIQYN